MYGQGGSRAEMWRLKSVPPVAFNQERPNLPEGGLDVQGGYLPPCSQGLFRRRDERPRGGPSVRLHRDTVRKMLEYSVPPGYRRQRPARRPKLDPYKGVLDQILEQDLSSPKKQRHTAKRIYERLRDEHGFPGKYTIVKDYVRERRRHTGEMFLPLSHPPDMPSATTAKLE